MTSEIQAVIFDCDGVLIDSWRSTCAFYNRIRQSVGLPPMNDQESQYVFVSTIAQGIERIIPPALWAPAKAAARSIDFAELAPLVQAQNGIEDLLKRLKTRGMPVGVDTNGGGESRLILTEVGVIDYFDVIVTADDVSRPKPHPEGVHKILGRFGVAPAKAVFIGDSEVDQKTAQAAGVPFWAYRNPALTAARSIDRFADLFTE
jgi:HAD superfamily hydrolase (TIGR01509 family)